MEKQKNNLIEVQEKIKIIFTKKYTIINSETEKLVDEILLNENGQKLIIEKIIERANIKENVPQTIDGLIYQKVVNHKNIYIKQKLDRQLPLGIIDLKKCSTVNYQNLQKLLIHQEFKEADILTQKYLCELTKQKNNKTKNWIYFTDIQFLQKEDLFTLDLLWKIYSKGKFGFSIQKKIWIKNNKNWDKLWEKICWLQHGIMKRYPEEFIWTVDAPEGHLPLSNQLRGTQTLLHIFNNIEW